MEECGQGYRRSSLGTHLEVGGGATGNKSKAGGSRVSGPRPRRMVGRHLQLREPSLLSSPGDFLQCLKKRKMGAVLQAGPFPREVYPHAPPEWCPRNPNRVWALNAPAYGLHDVPVVFP